MQTVTFETAKLLKDAGFPCPAPVVYGQMYYTPMGGLLSADVNTYLTRGIFAPTATDLIPTNWMLVRRVSEWECVSEYELDNFFSNNITPEHYFHHESPAEAAAMAWLHVNKKSEA